MEVVISFFSFLQGLGVAVMMPIILTIIGCALGAGFGKSLKAGLMVGVGFIGLNLVINQLFGTAIGPAVQEMIHRFGLTLNVIDVGWPAGAAIALGTTIGLVIMPGVSISQGFSLAYAPVAMGLNWLIDKIPGVRDIDIDVESMQKRFGVFGEPLFIGTVIGLIIGCVAYFDAADIAGSITKILTIGVTLGSVLILIPRMAALLMEGLLPISEAASNFIQQRVKNRGNIWIGLDSAVAVGHPVTLSLALICIPLMVLFALLLQPVGNQTLPFVDLAAGTYMLAVAVPVCKGNGFRGLIIGIVSVIIGLLISTALAPLITQSATQAGFDIAAAVGSTGVAGSSLITVLSDGGSPLSGLFVLFSSINPIVGVVVTGAIACALAVWNRSRILKEAAAMHEAQEA